MHTLLAQNDIYGFHYVETKNEGDALKDENEKLLLTAFSELIVLALANVRLRQNLCYQSIRDPLTVYTIDDIWKIFFSNHFTKPKEQAPSSRF